MNSRATRRQQSKKACTVQIKKTRRACGKSWVTETYHGLKQGCVGDGQGSSHHSSQVCAKHHAVEHLGGVSGPGPFQRGQHLQIEWMGLSTGVVLSRVRHSL